MGQTKTHRLSERVVASGRALRDRERATLARALRGMLAWQRTLRAWPRITSAPDATPYVSLYSEGKLYGCYGSHEGAPSERVARAFLLALADTRYGDASAHRADLAAEIAYITGARPVRADEALAQIAPGVDGVATFEPGAEAVLLPSVARERGYDANGMLDLLAKKANRARSNEGIVWIFRAETVSSRTEREKDPARGARRWLESLVAKDGAIAFEMDGGTGETRASGVMRLGRIAVAIEALVALRSRDVARAQKWLARELARPLGDKPDMNLGTLALAARAGLSEVPLESAARAIDPASCSPWHAAQAASVLGARTPPALWDAFVRSLDARPISPYGLMAARARGDAALTERCARALALSIRTSEPHAGGSTMTPVPETALTAVAIEALAPLASRDARRAVAAARAFVRARQILDVPASMHARALGAFVASPIAPVLRCDVTAHAALALWR